MKNAFGFLLALVQLISILSAACAGAGPLVQAGGQGPPEEGEPLLAFYRTEHTHIRSAVLAKQGALLVTGGQDPSLLIWNNFDFKKNLRPSAFHTRFPVAALALGAVKTGTQSRQLLIYGDIGGRIGTLDLSAGKELAAVQGHRGDIYALAVAPGGQTLISSGADETLRVWDLATVKVTDSKKLGLVGPIAFSPDGKLLALRVAERTAKDAVAVFAYPSWKACWRQGDDKNTVWKKQFSVGSLDFAPDGKFLVASGFTRSGHNIRFWDAANGTQCRGIEGHRAPEKVPDISRGRRQITGAVGPVKFSPNGLLLVTGGSDYGVSLWEVATKQPAVILQGHRKSISAVLFSADGSKLISASSNGDVCLWDLRKLKDWNEPEASKNQKPLQRAWENLRSQSPLQAVRASERFLANPADAIAFFETIPLVPKAPDPALVRKLIRELDSDAFATRQHAQAQLAAFGAAIEPLLKEAKAAGPGLEASRRLNSLLNAIRRVDGLAPDEMRLVRTIFLLERIPSPAARRLLRTLANDLTNDSLRSEAKQALTRLGS